MINAALLLLTITGAAGAALYHHLALTGHPGRYRFHMRTLVIHALAAIAAATALTIRLL